MAKKRSNGEGSFWQLSDPHRVYQITVGRKENGAPERKSFKGRTKAICKQRKEEWEAQQAALKAQAKNEQRETERLGRRTKAAGTFHRVGDTV